MSEHRGAGAEGFSKDVVFSAIGAQFGAAERAEFSFISHAFAPPPSFKLLHRWVDLHNP
jgi:hypothetical protein